LVRLVHKDALCGSLSRSREVLGHALRRVPGRHCDQRIVLAGREIGEACRIGWHVVFLCILAVIGLQVRYVQDAVRIGVVGALGGEGLDVVVDAVGEGDAGIERVELVVVVVDSVRVGEVDGEDTDPLGSCATRLSVRHSSAASHVTYSSYRRTGRLPVHRGQYNTAATTHAATTTGQWERRRGVGRGKSGVVDNGPGAGDGGGAKLETPSASAGSRTARACRKLS
jgi:hypothetical protein